MRARIFSHTASHVESSRARFVMSGKRRSRLLALLAAALCGATGQAADVPGYYTDPATGQVFREVRRTIERPEVTATTEQRERTVWTPKTVTETRPQARTVYSPITEYRWVPRVHNRWNPFRSPTVIYHHEPTTHWEARSEVVQQATARTEWIAEKRIDEVPVLQRRIVREERVEQEPVGTLAPQHASPPGPTSAVASRLRPLDRTELSRVIPGSSSAPGGGSLPLPTSAIATNPSRSFNQVGQRPTDLVPTELAQAQGKPKPRRSFASFAKG